MKKLAILLAMSFLIPLVTPAISHAAATYSDLAVGDPLGGGYKRRAKRRPAKPADPTAATEKAAPVAPAPAKPAEPAK